MTYPGVPVFLVAGRVILQADEAGLSEGSALPMEWEAWGLNGPPEWENDRAAGRQWRHLRGVQE